MRNAVHEAVSDIERFPEIGKVSFADKENAVEFRELTCRLSSIVYAIYNDEIYIVSVWNNRQDRSRLYADLRQLANKM